MAVKIGDKVKLLNETGEGVLKEMRPGGKVLVEVDGFEREFPLSEVVIISSDNEEEATTAVNEEKVKAAAKGPDSPTLVTKIDYQDEGIRHLNPANQPIRRNPHGVREIDLHLHNLVANENNLANADKLEIQLRRFEVELQAAINSHERKIVFIHGVGEGVLKQEIRARLDGIAGIEYFDGPYHLYGYGATQVEVV